MVAPCGRCSSATTQPASTWHEKEVSPLGPLRSTICFGSRTERTAIGISAERTWGARRPRIPTVSSSVFLAAATTPRRSGLWAAANSGRHIAPAACSPAGRSTGSPRSGAWTPAAAAFGTEMPQMRWRRSHAFGRQRCGLSHTIPMCAWASSIAGPTSHAGSY
jgi:hypothetical protein